MSEKAKPVIKELTRKYLERLGPEKAGNATLRDILQNILTGDIYFLYEHRKITGSETKEKRKAWRSWMDGIQEEIWKDLSGGNDTTAAEGMHAPRVEPGAAAEGMHALRVAPGAAAEGTAMPAQSQSMEVLRNLQQQLDELRQASQSMHSFIDEGVTRMQENTLVLQEGVTRMQESFDALRGLKDRQNAFGGLISSLQMQLRQAMDAQDVGAPAMAQVPAPASRSTNRVGASAVGAALARLPVNPTTGAAGGAQASAAALGSMAPSPDRSSAALADLPVNPTRGAAGGAQASAADLGSMAPAPARRKPRAKKPKAAHPQMVINLETSNIYLDIDTICGLLENLFKAKYPDMKEDVSFRTKKDHVRAYLRKFVIANIQQMLETVEDISKYDTKDLVLQALLWEWQRELKEYMRITPELAPNPNIPAFKMLTCACEGILGLACDHGEIPWAPNKSVQTPLSKLDNFEQESAFIRLAFEKKGVKCDEHKQVVKIEVPESPPNDDEGDRCIVIDDDDTDSEEDSGGKP
jgi:hypothetical protein